MNVLGIWDGHDSGAALLKGDHIIFAANEERFTRNKLEVEFPSNSIREALKFAKLKPDHIEIVAISTSDFSKTLTRVFPALKRKYYLIRRRKVEPSAFNRFSKKAKYVLTEIGPSSLTRRISGMIVRNCLEKIGFRRYRLIWVDHHLAHVASAVCTSPYEEGLVLSLDGIGDGLSGMIGIFDGGRISILSKFKGRDSLGIFFEHVTNLLNMRELEDEGKVMALASFGYPIPDDQNPLLQLFSVDGVKIKAKYHATGLYRKLQRILYLYPAEQFAYMAQRVLEVCIVKLVENAVGLTGKNCLAYAGGVASNIKVNMLLKNHKDVAGLHVFPHMDDGGLALGAALYDNLTVNGVPRCRLENLFLGPSYTISEIEQVLSAFPAVRYQRFPAIEEKVVQLVKEGHIVLWFQGRMEYGPRALGDRSILALPSSISIKNKLNIYLKKRVWYQPFCPTMLSDAAAEILEDYNGTDNLFMTVGYQTKEKYADKMIAVINADNSCRPQILSEGGPQYGRYLAFLKKMRELTGRGVVLNTSFNKHGESIINNPKEALELLTNSRFEYLVLEDYLVWKEQNT